MPRGNPDYNVPEYDFFTVETPNSDIVAERQGFSRLDNRGRVLFSDDFRGGLNRWKLSYYPQSLAPVHIHDAGMSIGYHGAIRCASVEDGGYSGIYQRLILPVSSRLGYELGFYLPEDFASITCTLAHLYTGAACKAGTFTITGGTGEIKIHYPGGTYSILTPSSLALFTDRWVSVKLVIDVSTFKYVRFMIGNTQYDLEAYDLALSEGGFTGATLINFASAAEDAVNIEPGYIGYVIVSGDEP